VAVEVAEAGAADADPLRMGARLGKHPAGAFFVIMPRERVISARRSKSLRIIDTPERLTPSAAARVSCVIGKECSSMRSEAIKIQRAIRFWIVPIPMARAPCAS
jgi:hypothetical protein